MSNSCEVEKVLNKKIYKGETFYQIKWANSKSPTWEKGSNCNCDHLIREYERILEKESNDENNDEWEVEQILKKRVRNHNLEYLVKWKNWDGEPTWVKERDCQCINLIAAFENPKLKKLWTFEGTNTRLWINKNEILAYMRKFARKKKSEINIISFEDDFPLEEKPLKLVKGLNIGPLCYKKHWYLVIALVSFLGVTKRILVGDPLNTLIGVDKAYVHPVFKRLVSVYKPIPVQILAMTPMNRSDVCAFYVLAAFERALKIFRTGAKFAPNQLLFGHRRPEIIRSKVKPESDDELSVALPIGRSFLDGPKCEFCDKLFEAVEAVDEHILRKHFKAGSQEIKSPRPSRRVTRI